MRKILALSCALAVVAGAHAQNRIPIGVDLGVYFPSNSTVQNLFGDSWFRIGLTPLSFQRPDHWRLTFDVGVLNRSENGNKITLIPLTFGFTRSFAAQGASARPYVAVRVGPYFGDVNVPTLSIDDNQIGFNANAAVGITFNDRFYIEGRYDFYSDFDDLDFSGFAISVGVRLFELRI